MFSWVEHEKNFYNLRARLNEEADLGLCCPYMTWILLYTAHHNEQVNPDQLAWMHILPFEIFAVCIIMGKC